MRLILVPVANRPECLVALDTAFHFAKTMSSNVLGVHIRPTRDESTVLPLEAALVPSAAAYTNLGAPSGDDEGASREAADLFAAEAKKHGLKLVKKPSGAGPATAMWKEKLGTPEYVMPLICPLSDLVVVSRPLKRGGAKASIFMMEALMRAHRPVLILPQKKKKSVGKHIAIAWNRSGEAARAVATNMALLQAAEQVTILTTGTQGRLGPDARDLAEYLAHYGIHSHHKNLGNNEGPEAVVDGYKDAGADLLLMGAFSRSRWSEILFGGFTRHMLRETDIPVVMLHS